MISYSKSSYFDCYQSLIIEKIRELIQTKHLYQKVRIEEEEIRSLVNYPTEFTYSEKEYSVNIQSFLEYQKCKKWIQSGFQHIKNNSGIRGDYFLGDQSKPTAPDILGYYTSENLKPHLVDFPETNDALFTVPNVEIFCSNCKQRKMFSPIYFDSVDSISPSIQFFFLVFECQICNNEKVSFSLKREENKLILVGRSQLEFNIPDPIFPKTENYLELISRANISHESGGYNIAAISYLRLFIEKYVRNETGIITREENQNISDICDKYAESLPRVIRDFIPSLKSIYMDLSEAYHEGDTEKKDEYGILYEECLENLKKHFHGKKAINQ